MSFLLWARSAARPAIQPSIIQSGSESNADAPGKPAVARISKRRRTVAARDGASVVASDLVRERGSTMLREISDATHLFKPPAESVCHRAPHAGRAHHDWIAAAFDSRRCVDSPGNERRATGQAKPPAARFRAAVQPGAVSFCHAPSCAHVWPWRGVVAAGAWSSAPLARGNASEPQKGDRKGTDKLFSEIFTPLRHAQNHCKHWLF